MIKHNQDGAINSFLLPFILSVVALLAAIGFGVWAYSGKLDYKNNVDQKIADAVVIAKQAEDTQQQKIYFEQEKLPLRTFKGPEAYGSVIVQYPKTWSAYADITANGNAVVDSYFAPGIVPSLTGATSVFSLRVQIINQSYAESVHTLTASQSDNNLTISPYALPKVPKQIGVRASGSLSNGKTGTTIYLPLRDKTLIIATDGNDYIGDFDKNILPNVTFTP